MGLSRNKSRRRGSRPSLPFKVGRKETARAKAHVRFATCIREKLTEASLVSEDTASSIAVDFADIAAIGERHRALIDQLLRLRFPRDLRKLESLLIKAQVDLLWENDWHLKSLKHQLPKILRSLNKRLRSRKAAKDV